MNSRKFLLACSNTMVQYFNYAIFGLSAIALASELMPGEEASQQLTNFFAIIIVTVLARPIGSFIFGFIGDIIGRKLSIIIAGFASSIGALAVAFIPTYISIGLTSSVLLILFRMIFLGGLAGEIDGIRLYISETVSNNRQNFTNGIITLFTQVGAFSASVMLNFFGDKELLYSAWRICFIIGGVLGILLSAVRIFLPESVEFMRNKSQHPSTYYNITFAQILNGQSLLLLKTIIIFGSIGSLYQFNIIFLPALLKVDYGINLYPFVTFFIASYALSAPFWGYIADRAGNLIIINLISIVIILGFIALYYTLASNIAQLLPYSIICITISMSAYSICSHILLKKNINIGMRYRIFSLGHSIGSLVISTPTAYISTIIEKNYGIEYSVLYPACMIALGSICSRFIAKQFK